MSNLENMLAITAAINQQKRDKKEFFQVVEDLFNSITVAIMQQKENNKDFLPTFEDLFKKDKSLDLSSRVEDEKNFMLKQNENIFEKNEEKKYSPFKVFSEYLSAFKDKLYGYYSSIKESLKKGTNKGGYTDKLLKEIEDWGVIYFRTVFQNLKRITPLGKAHRYMQHLWICQTKNLK